MRILFNSRKYDGIAGGVERTSVALMNEMVCRGHQVALTSLDPPSAQTFYPLDPRIEWTRIDIGNPAQTAKPGDIVRRLMALRAVINRFNPDVAIGFQQGAFITMAVAALGSGTPVIAAERNAPHRFEHLKDGHGRTFQFQSFRFARFVTVQFESYREHYPSYVRDRIVSIPNPVYPSLEVADPTGASTVRKTVLTVARLSYQKNQAVLVKAFARLADRFPDWDLVLVGDGEDRHTIKTLAGSLLPPGRVRLTGAQSAVGDYFQSAQIFCLPSRWEGFPNALAEAMTYGLPSVGFAHCAGINSLIQPGRTGLLAAPAGDDGALAEGLGKLMSDADLRVAMGREARTAMAAYAPRAVFDQWESLFMRAGQR